MAECCWPTVSSATSSSGHRAFQRPVIGLVFHQRRNVANLELVREKPLLIIGLTIGFMLLKIAFSGQSGGHPGFAAASRGFRSACPQAANSPLSVSGLAAVEDREHETPSCWCWSSLPR